MDHQKNGRILHFCSPWCVESLSFNGNVLTASHFQYCCCCRFSPDANIRSLEPTFNALAKLHIDQSIPMADRMVQVVQACVMMTVYLCTASLLCG